MIETPDIQRDSEEAKSKGSSKNNNTEELIRNDALKHVEAAWDAQRRLMKAYIKKLQQEETVSSTLSTMTIIQDPFEKIGVSPAGPYCKVCSRPLSTKRWTQHFNLCHKEFKFFRQSTKMEDQIEMRRLQAVKDPRISHVHPFDKGETKKYFCSGCQKTFSRIGNFELHLNKKNYSCMKGQCHFVNCYKMKCGRYFPVEDIAPPIVTPIPNILLSPRLLRS
jgi:hypothetical protein